LGNVAFLRVLKIFIDQIKGCLCFNNHNSIPERYKKNIFSRLIIFRISFYFIGYRGIIVI